ncbi:alpha/beta hydrolase [Nodosilinea sp. E11]|uniref:alpha/beta fold hydrolase n=1 Tax=Nodosilinea sp. E11 TaxID=3037479 RepID=UPI0029349A4C|nr:alpha/beta hydrolase [Nodosilinea sp. E11]WOD37470.1 alpha/beta hydrolase [Nodosilinea sp. E11]
MPKVTVGDIDINYKIQGQGETLLMIVGLSFSLLDWGIKLPDLLSQHYKVILFDNRDAGETSCSPYPYSLAQMASDAAGLLDAIGEPKAHVFGVSMGGMIAQYFALDHADKLNKLILGCTMAGGSCSQTGDIGSFFGDDLLKLLFTTDFIRHNQADLDLFLQATKPYHSTGEALLRQLNAMSSHDTCNAVGKIVAPTLVITGDRDRVIPPENSAFLAQNIPNAQQEIIKDAAHAFSFSHPLATATTIINFLEP